MEFPKIITTEQLELEARTAVETLENAAEYGPALVQEAGNTIEQMKRALADLGYTSISTEEIPWAWSMTGRMESETLVRSDAVSEYWAEKAVEFGYVSKEAVEYLGEAVDWQKVADNEPSYTVRFNDSTEYRLWQ